jgi:hypothetical protein
VTSSVTGTGDAVAELTLTAPSPVGAENPIMSCGPQAFAPGDPASANASARGARIVVGYGDDGVGERGVERIGERGLLGTGQENPSRGRSRNRIGSRTVGRNDSIRSAVDQRRMQCDPDETRVFPPARGRPPR